MTIVSDLLGTLDEARALLDDAGLRPYTVFVRVITYSGERVGDGSKSVVDTPITVAGGRRPKVVDAGDKSIVAGGVIAKQRFEIKNITPPYSGGGISPDTLDPPKGSNPTEVFYVLMGPGLPPKGALCKKVADGFDRVFGYSITVETIGKEA